MRTVFGGVAFLIGISNITSGILKLNAHENYGVLLLIIGVGFVALGVGLVINFMRKGVN